MENNNNNELLDLLQGQLSDQVLDQMTQQIGAASREQTAVAAKGIISSLLSGASKQAESEEGAYALASSLDQDADDSLLDNVMDFFTNQGQNEQTSPYQPGQNMVNNTLGNNQGNILDMINRISGLDSNKAGNLMSMLAPIVMSALSRTKKTQNLDSSGLFSLLNNTTQQAQTQQTNATSGLLNMLLDSDKDGSIVDDVASMGMRMLGNFFK